MKLKNWKRQNEFSRDGAVSIPNFLSRESIDTIKGLYNELGIKELNGIYTNVKDRSFEVNNRINRVFKECYEHPINLHFEDVQIGGGAFLIKGTGVGSESSLHQDWNIVDESIYQSAAIFCPLEDVDEDNGCIQIVKGSHKWFSNIRSFNIPSIFLEFNLVKEHLKSYPLKAGDAIVFRHNVFHGSKPNYTSTIRVAASMSIASDSANLIHYFKENEFIKILSVDDDFFNRDVKSIFEGNYFDMNVEEEKEVSNFSILDKKEFYQFYDSLHKTSIMSKLKQMTKWF